MQRLIQPLKPRETLVILRTRIDGQHQYHRVARRSGQTKDDYRDGKEDEDCLDQPDGNVSLHSGPLLPGFAMAAVSTPIQQSVVRVDNYVRAGINAVAFKHLVDFCQVCNRQGPVQNTQVVLYFPDGAGADQGNANSRIGQDPP